MLFVSGNKVRSERIRQQTKLNAADGVQCDDGEVNACLFIAAPAMYEALEATARHLVIDHKYACESDTYERGEYHVSKCDCHLNRRWREVEAALKLARGES